MQVPKASADPRHNRKISHKKICKSSFYYGSLSTTIIDSIIILLLTPLGFAHVSIYRLLNYIALFSLPTQSPEPTIPSYHLILHQIATFATRTFYVLVFRETVWEVSIHR